MADSWNKLPNYSYRGARALIILQDKHLREFLTVWRTGKDAGIQLPKTEDADYQSFETILFHVLRASRGYLTWLSEKLQMLAPTVNPVPELSIVGQEAEGYIGYLFECWSKQFASVPEEDWNTVFKSRWNVEMALESMLEHAVMHPIRHAFQIQEWIQKGSAITS